MASHIAFIGLGTMGLPMAQVLRAAGHVVTGMDVDIRAREAFGDGREPDSAHLRGAGVVVTMLPEAAHVSEVYDRIILPSAEPGTLLIDCSTIDVGTTRDLAVEAGRRGLQRVDAPVSGGPEGAAKGALSFMVGGEEEAYAGALPVLEAMGGRIMHFGPPGAGQAAKACHNMICGITAMAVLEGFALAEALGLDPARFYELCAGAAAQSWTLENRCPVPGVVPAAPASNGYAPGFAARLMAKDLRLAQAAANASGQSTPFGALAAESFTKFTEETGGALDFSSFYRALRPVAAAQKDKI